MGSFEQFHPPVAHLHEHKPQTNCLSYNLRIAIACGRHSCQNRTPAQGGREISCWQQIQSYSFEDHGQTNLRTAAAIQTKPCIIMLRRMFPVPAHRNSSQRVYSHLAAAQRGLRFSQYLPAFTGSTQPAARGRLSIDLNFPCVPVSNCFMEACDEYL